MKKAIVTLKSASTYGQSRHVQEPAKNKESPDDFEKRTWRERCHVNDNGNVYIPGIQFAQSLREAAKYLNMQVKGKGKSTYTKNFESGIIVIDNIVLPVKKEDVKGITVFVPSNGMPGGGKRVMKTFPIVDEWEGTITYHVIDDLITEDVFKQALYASGNFIGIGYWRPRNRGYYGRFTVEDVKWVEE